MENWCGASWGLEFDGTLAFTTALAMSWAALSPLPPHAPATSFVLL
jgi:hypothetical protein